MFERRNVVTAAAVLVGFVAAAWLRPEPPPSFRAEVARIGAAEREILNRYQAAAAQFKAGEIDDAQFADVIERGVLGPYADVQREIEELKAHPDADGEFVAQLTRFTALRAMAGRCFWKRCGSRTTRSCCSTSRSRKRQRRSPASSWTHTRAEARRSLFDG